MPTKLAVDQIAGPQTIEDLSRRLRLSAAGRRIRWHMNFRKLFVHGQSFKGTDFDIYYSLSLLQQRPPIPSIILITIDVAVS